MTFTDTYGVTDVTAPVVAVTLAEQVAAVERFSLTGDDALRDWTVTIDPDLDGMVIRWNYLRLTVGERSALELARFIAREQLEGRRFITRNTAIARIGLGWPRGGGAPMVTCLVCRTRAVAAQQHAPGSSECHDTRAERRIEHAS